jgi:hypothetical protein
LTKQRENTTRNISALPPENHVDDTKTTWTTPKPRGRHSVELEEQHQRLCCTNNNFGKIMILKEFMMRRLDVHVADTFPLCLFHPE